MIVVDVLSGLLLSRFGHWLCHSMRLVRPDSKCAA